MFNCKECNSSGFEPSLTGRGCTFCDGTEGGNPPNYLILNEKEQSRFKAALMHDFRVVIKQEIQPGSLQLSIFVQYEKVFVKELLGF